MKWTEQQEKAITEKGSDILVSAAAGSGKTAVLTERIRRLIMEEGISIENMLVVTFSNAAAAEMKEKIIKSLTQNAKEDKANETYLRTQIRKARSSDISTFHKFSMGVIRRYFYLTDVEPDFGICDNSRREIMISEALDELIEERYESRDSYQAGDALPAVSFTDFLRHYCSVRNENELRDMINEVYKFIMSMPEPFTWIDKAVESAKLDEEAFKDSKVYDAMLQNAVDDMERTLRYAGRVADMTSGLPGIGKKAENDAERIKNMIAKLKAHDMEAFDADARQKLETFRATKEEKEDYDEIKDAVASIRDKIKKTIKEVREKAVPANLQEALKRVQDTYIYAAYLADMVKDFHERFTAKKREKNLLDFNDIEHVALGILGHDEIAAEYRKHFEVIFIDEYQDSSIVQETLISRISRGDNVYMVGDVKQSIYKFRLAEPEIFIDKYNDFREHKRPGMRIDLNRNFRSKGNIINAVNGIFKNVMSRKNGGIEYDEDASLKKGSTYEGELDYPVKLFLVDGAGDSGYELEEPTLGSDDVCADGTDGAAEASTDSSRQAAAAVTTDEATSAASRPAGFYMSAYDRAVTSEIDDEIAELKRTELEARFVADMAARRIGQKIYDSKKETEREVTSGDIVVLLRSAKGSADIYAEALKNVGLPAYIDVGEGYFETAEIEVFMNLLRVIDNKLRDIPLLSVLRSQIFGFSIDELARIRLKHPKTSYSEALLACASLEEDCETDELAMKCADAVARLDAWRMDARYMPLEDFLWKLMKDTSYLDYVAAMPGGDRRQANLRTLVDKAIDYSSSQTKGLFGFIRYVEAMNENKVSTGQSMQTGDVGNMVRIMTIHKSKGLEFPVVILAGLGKRFNNQKNVSNVVMHKDLGMALEYSAPEKSCHSKTISMRVIAKQKEKEELAEEMRILYVAMTRAMDELVLVASLADVKKELEKYDHGLYRDPSDVGGLLDWILPYCEPAGIGIEVLTRDKLSSTRKKEYLNQARLKNELEQGFPTFKDEKGLTAVIEKRFAFQYPYADDVFSKSKFSVSELNRLLRGEPLALPVQAARAKDDIAAVLRDERLAQSAAIESQAEVLRDGRLAQGAAIESQAAALAGPRLAGEASGDMQGGTPSTQPGVPPDPSQAPAPAASLARAVSTTAPETAPAPASVCGASPAPAHEAAPVPAREGAAALVPAFLKAEQPVTAAMRGTLVHKVLELIPFSTANDEAAVRTFVASLVDKGIMTAREAEHVDYHKVASFFASDIGRRACHADWLRREWTFTLKKDRNEISAMARSRETAEELRRTLPPELMIQGIIDCCFCDADGVVILDYKTDRVDPRAKAASIERIRKEYENQLSFYAEVVEKALDVTVSKKILFLIDCAEYVCLS